VGGAADADPDALEAEADDVNAATAPATLMTMIPAATKEVVLLRHARSLGQVAHPRARRSSDALVDAALSPGGWQQARLLRVAVARPGSRVAVDLVVTSPLTRALQTAVAVFSGALGADADEGAWRKFVVAPDLAEVDSSRHVIPENRGRPLAHVARDRAADLSVVRHMDLARVEALGWPAQERPPNPGEAEDSRARHGRRDGDARHHRRRDVRDTLEWVLDRPEPRVVLVTHHNWIQGAVATGCAPPRVENATPMHAVIRRDAETGGRAVLQLVRGPHEWFRVDADAEHVPWE